jgi:DNA-binding response OmpR family regulator
MKVLIIEDEPSLREVMTKFLEQERFVVESAANYRDALSKLVDYDYDCILLDIMLPDGNGLDLLREAAKMHKNENVIILSAKDSVDDKVAGLDLGADDYLAKPFHLSELNARIKSVIRRKVFSGERLVTLGNTTINPDRFEVSIDGKLLELNRKEYDILYYLSGRPDHLVEKTTLAEAVWGDHIDQSDNFDFIYAQLKNLRKKLREAGSAVEIKSIYGYGYKLHVE